MQINIYILITVLLIIITLIVIFKIFHKKKQKILLLNEISLQKIKKILINNDVSLNITNYLLAKLNDQYKEQCTLSDLKKIVEHELYKILSKNTANLITIQNNFYNKYYGQNHCLVFVLLGNNGVGKTSFAAKLAQYFIHNGILKEKILMTSLDFFRAGASQQLEELAKKINVKYLSPKNNSKGHAYDAYQYAQDQFYDILILDTAGRIHTNDNLLIEIKDIMSTLKSLNASIETIMVMDNNFGGISINSFEAFNAITNISGIVLTKTDTQIGGGWVVKLLEAHKDVKLFGHVAGESMDSFSEFDVNNYCKKIINWTQLDEE